MSASSAWSYETPQTVPLVIPITFQNTPYTQTIINQINPVCLINFSLNCQGQYDCNKIGLKVTDATGRVIIQTTIRDLYFQQGMYTKTESGLQPFISVYDDVNLNYQVNIIPSNKVTLRGLIVYVIIPVADGVYTIVGSQATLTINYLLEVNISQGV